MLLAVSTMNVKLMYTMSGLKSCCSDGRMGLLRGPPPVTRVGAGDAVATLSRG